MKVKLIDNGNFLTTPKNALAGKIVDAEDIGDAYGVKGSVLNNLCKVQCFKYNDEFYYFFKGTEAVEVNK